MQHISEILKRIDNNKARKALYVGNKDIFLKYFDSEYQYDQMIQGGAFDKMDRVVKENSKFNSQEFFNKIRGENESN